MASIARALLPSSATGPGQSSAMLPGASEKSCGACGVDVDRCDARVRVGRAHEHGVRLVLLRRVLDEAAEPLHQRGILHARLEMMVVSGRLIHAFSPQFGLPVIQRNRVTSMG